VIRTVPFLINLISKESYILWENLENIVSITSISEKGYSFYKCKLNVISINIHTVELNIPAWHYYDGTVNVDIEDIPIMFYGVLLDCSMMMANVNLGAIRREDLIIKDYELF
jgi:hypothetical protein